jgi:hypothetical protein
VKLGGLSSRGQYKMKKRDWDGQQDVFNITGIGYGMAKLKDSG